MDTPSAARFEAEESRRRAPDGQPLVIRVDGRSFSRFTAGMASPFDTDFGDLMVDVARYLVSETNARVGYTQSDEITLILETGAGPGKAAASEQLLFDGRLQKLASVAAGLATARFLSTALKLWPDRCAAKLPVFDARVFPVPDRAAAIDILLWRESDAARNALNMAAGAHYPHEALHGRSHRDLLRLLGEKGIRFADYPARYRQGVYLQRRQVLRDLAPEALAAIPAAYRPSGPVRRFEVQALDLPPLREVGNAIAVIFEGDSPRLRPAAEIQDGDIGLSVTGED